MLLYKECLPERPGPIPHMLAGHLDGMSEDAIHETTEPMLVGRRLVLLAGWWSLASWATILLADGSLLPERDFQAYHSGEAERARERSEPKGASPMTAKPTAA